MHVVARADQAEYSRTKCKMRHRQATTARDKLALAEADVRSEERARVMVTGEAKKRQGVAMIESGHGGGGDANSGEVAGHRRLGR